MSSRRTAILIGAIVVGVIAVVLIVQYVNGIKSEVDANRELVPVYVAKEQVPRGYDGGQAVSEQKIVQGQLPREYVPATAITSTDDIEKKVALFPIAPGTVIVNDMFVDPTQAQVTFRDRLRNRNYVAISIQVDAVKGVGGFLQPGDEVNMMIYQDNATVKSQLEATGTGTGGVKWLPPELAQIQAPTAESYVNVGGPQWLILDNTARYMYQKVQILAVGSSALTAPGESESTSSSGSSSSGSNKSNVQNNPGLITLQVPPEAAQWIATGQSAGFYLSLVGKDYKPRVLNPLPVVVNRLPGEDPAYLDPYKYQEPQG